MKVGMAASFLIGVRMDQLDKIYMVKFSGLHYD